MKFGKNSQHCIITDVYARCLAVERFELWDQLEDIAHDSVAWVVGGDFNVILSEEEKYGGLEFTQREANDFASCISVYGLQEIKTGGSKFTWWNGRIEQYCIFKRMDRIFVNQKFMDLLPSSEVQHLIRQGSDHSPLHLMCDTEEENILKLFRFLNFWVKHKDFKEVAQQL